MKRCILCGADAKLCIKNSTDYYCHDCAGENFGNVDYLVKIEEEARRLKELVNKAREE